MDKGYLAIGGVLVLGAIEYCRVALEDYRSRMEWYNGVATDLREKGTSEITLRSIRPKLRDSFRPFA